MADRVILLNGLPGAGKSTLGTALAPLMAAKFVSKDKIKETLADMVGVDVPRLGMISMEAVWSVAATPCHPDAQRLAEDWDTWAVTAEPLALTPVIRVDTTTPVDLPALARSLSP
ncbi:MAG TPA: hypothetical protein VF062_08270 [Candidatus Limnocylindrales bacterium]